jgi:hypothetical protein
MTQKDFMDWGNRLKGSDFFTVARLDPIFDWEYDFCLRADLTDGEYLSYWRMHLQEDLNEIIL